MSWFQNLPIKRKLTLVILLACSTVVLLVCVALAGYELFEYRRAMLRDMTVLADVLAKNTRAALMFQDEKSARDSLQALQSEPYVTAACLYSADGTPFADYSVSGSEQFSRPDGDGYRYRAGHLELFRPVTLNDKRVGTIYLQAGLAGVYKRLQLFGWVAAAVLGGAILVALILAQRIGRPISVPILSLAETTRAITEKKDYTLRAKLHGTDEIGALTSSFNQMVESVEGRDKALQAANDSLRGEIAERRLAEDRAQSQLARLELLNKITRGIGEREDLHSIFGVVIKNLEERLPLDFCCICLHDNTSSLVVANVGVLSRALGRQMGIEDQARVPVDEDGLSRCLHGHLVYEPDTAKIPFPFPERLAAAGLHSFVGAPLLVESQVFGVLISARKNPDAFSSGECEFLKQLSGHIALASHHAQLYNALQRAYEDLRQTQQAVMQQERLRALGQMASGIAHDINNAISPVALYTESLLENEPELSPRARDYLTTIQNSIEDVAATVARMREFYRQREPQLTLTPVQINKLIQQVLDLSRARWSDMPQQRGIVIKLVTQFAPDLPAIMGVESELREALVNLIFNAVDAMPEGGTLTIRTTVHESPANAVQKSLVRHVQVEVADTGVGMDEDTRRRCLEPFFTTKGERGTGLGLAMVYGIVQRHGADIEIDSTPGKGATMRLVFPVAASTATPAAGQAPFTLPQRLRILLVDDDPLLLKSLRDILETDGHAVITANSGQAGVDTFGATKKRGERFDVVITDLGMPNMDGRKVASEIKKLSPEMPVIMLTGWGRRLLAEGDVPGHVDRVLSKPPKLRELREALAACVKQKLPEE